MIMIACIKRLSLPLLLLAFSSTVFAKVFEVKDINIEGLQRVSAGKVFASFPIAVGDLVDAEALRQAARALIQTGNFEDVAFLEEDGRLIIRLKERPAVAELNIDGNKQIKTEDLLVNLRDNGLAEGQIFKRDVLEGMAQSLRGEYVKNGLYGSSVNTRVKTLPRNRVAVYLDITEGSPAAIKHINIIGNKAFSESELLENFELQTTGWLSWFSKDDKYGKEKLSGDLERLESFYKDRGYLGFTIESAPVAVSPDKTSVYITVNINEGEIYKVSEVALAGELVIPEEEIRRLVAVQEGRTYSQYWVNYSSELIKSRFGNDGYTNAKIESAPELNEEDNTAKVTFFIQPGKKVYVRRIEIRGNTKTADDVARREMRQMEGAVASNWKIERGRQRLERTHFVKRGSVEVETTDVPRVDDQVDVLYSFEEQASGDVSATFGFSQTSGLQLGASLSDRNFLGTGKQVSIGIQRSDFQKSINLGYNDPYFTVDGVSAGFNIFARTSDFAEIGLTSYETESHGAKFDFNYPLGENQQLSYGFGYENLKIDVSQRRLELFGASSISPEILKFIADNNAQNDLFTFTLGWGQSTLNSGLFATAGTSQRLTLEAAPPLLDDLAYYKVTYAGQKYFPLGKYAKFLSGWSFRVRTDLGYGDGLGDTPRLPFYKNFYAGGYNSVRGYERNTLGPRVRRSIRSSLDQVLPVADTQNTDPFGGNVLVTGSAEVIFPLPFIKDQSQVQASFFFDVGNVFDTNCSSESVFDNPLSDNPLTIIQEKQENCFKPDAGELRYSFGIGATWITGFGPITFSISKPLNSGPLDEDESFQFSLGNSF